MVAVGLVLQQKRELTGKEAEQQEVCSRVRRGRCRSSTAAQASVSASKEDGMGCVRKKATGTWNSELW